MIWKKHNLIFNPKDHNLPNNCEYFAQSPQALVMGDFVRIYFSTRSSTINDGKYLSHIAFVDYSRDFKEIIQVSQKQVIALGNLGCFDEHGIFPFSPIKVGNKLWAYTCGWSRRVSVSVETSTGLVYSDDHGLSYKRMGNGPILTNSLHEPMLVGDSFVLHEEDNFHMWYIFGKKWAPETASEPPARVYKIAYAHSTDGINWTKKEGQQIITDVIGDDECQALPTVVKLGDKYHMYFCFRYSTDFRTNPKRGYRLGYAYSTDGINWTRNDELGGIKAAENDWDSDMMCYPNIFKWDDKVYLLYNGNQFGKMGFGMAELIAE